MPDLNTLILPLLISCPLLGAILVGLLPRRVAREGALAVAVLNFIFSLHLVQHWDFVTTDYQFEVTKPWIPNFGISLHLGVDGLSVLMILLATFLMPLTILASWNSVTKHTKAFFVCLLLLESALCGVFSALDVILFYVFYEAVLVPTYLLIGIWGGGRRFYASIKYFLANFLGSVLMWIVMFYVYFQQDVNSRSFDWATFTKAAQGINAPMAMWLFSAFAVAFAIKSALFPLHTPAPDAYGEAPTAGSVFLSAVLAKMGTYGFLRFALPSFPGAAEQAAPTMIMLGLIAVIYGAMVAVMQKDFKRTIAYSSISHIGLIVAGIFAALLIGTNDVRSSLSQGDLKNVAISGAALQMFNHGISTAALFLLLGYLYERRGTTLIAQYGGLAKPMPRFAVLFWIALFSSIGLPGLNGFIGEFLLLQGLMAVKFLYAALGATGVILGAVYMLKLSRNLLFGEITNEANRALPDVTGRETFVVTILLLVALWVGVAPQSFLKFVNPSAANVATMAQASPSKTLAQAPGNIAKKETQGKTTLGKTTLGKTTLVAARPENQPAQPELAP